MFKNIHVKRLVMIDTLANMWNKSKILFFLLFPLVLIAIAINFYKEYQVMKAKESLKDVESKDKQLEAEKQAALDAAKEAEFEANQLAKNRENRKEEDIEEGWHK